MPTTAPGVMQLDILLMFSRKAKLPLDISLRISVENSKVPHSLYVSRLKEDLERAFKLASKAANIVHQRKKKNTITNWFLYKDWKFETWD